MERWKRRRQNPSGPSPANRTVISSPSSRLRACSASASTPGVHSSYSELKSCRRRATSPESAAGARRIPALAPSISASAVFDLALEAEVERFQGELLGDVEVEAAARVLDRLGGAAGGGRIEAVGAGAKLRDA